MSYYRAGEGRFYCDCQKGIKGKLYWESMGLIGDRTRNTALTKTSSPAVRVQPNYVFNGDEETEIHLVEWGQQQFVANTEEDNIQVETKICTSQSNC